MTKEGQYLKGYWMKEFPQQSIIIFYLEKYIEYFRQDNAALRKYYISTKF